MGSALCVHCCSHQGRMFLSYHLVIEVSHMTLLVNAELAVQQRYASPIQYKRLPFVARSKLATNTSSVESQTPLGYSVQHESHFQCCMGIHLHLKEETRKRKVQKCGRSADAGGFSTQGRPPGCALVLRCRRSGLPCDNSPSPSGVQEKTLRHENYV